MIEQLFQAFIAVNLFFWGVVGITIIVGIMILFPILVIMTIAAVVRAGWLSIRGRQV